MTSWLQRALRKAVAPTPTKALALKARLKLMDLNNGMAVWFTPQEIEAIEQDLRDLKGSIWRSLFGIPGIIGLSGLIIDFQRPWLTVSIIIVVLWSAMEIAAWRNIKAELRVMRDHQTTAHRSFFEGPAPSARES